MGGGPIMLYDFDQCLNFSKTAQAESSDILTIKSMLTKCSEVLPANIEMDKSGVDYIAKTESGREIYIDIKTRTQGCSKYWRAKSRSGESIPELAIETWSVIPNEQQKSGKIGWTLDHKKETDLILYRFDESDHGRAFLLCFHTLRMAAEKKIDDWRNSCKVDRQRNHGYYSESIFVRADWVLDSMRSVMCGHSVSERAFYVQQLLFAP
jgi:hypothetical protein